MATSRERAHTRLEALIKKVAEGDRGAFSKLYDQTAPKLFGICLRLIMDRDAAENTLQEVYARIWQGARAYRSDFGGPMAWLIGVTREAALERVRARVDSDLPLDDVPELELDEADALDPPDLAPGERRRVAHVLAALPHGDATAIRGAYLEADSYGLLAARLDLPVSTVRSGLRRSLLKLREELGR